MRIPTTRIGLVAAAASLAACSSATTNEHMRTHYERVRTVQAGVASGDLREARNAARWVAEHEQPGGMPTEAAPYVEQMRSAARDVVTSDGNAGAALAVGRMGATCGSCHSATRASVRINVVTSPEPGGPVTGQMRRHFWASDRMWEGLIGPSDEAWTTGSRMLAESSNYVSQMGAVSVTRARDVESMAGQLRTLGRRGEGAAGQNDRAAIYGEVLATCNGCHQMANVDIGTR